MPESESPEARKYDLPPSPPAAPRGPGAASPRGTSPALSTAAPGSSAGSAAPSAPAASSNSPYGPLKHSFNSVSESPSMSFSGSSELAGNTPEERERAALSHLESALQQQMVAFERHTALQQEAGEALQHAQAVLATLTRTDLSPGAAPEGNHHTSDVGADDFCVLPLPKEDPAAYLPEVSPHAAAGPPAPTPLTATALEGLNALGTAEVPQLSASTDPNGRSKQELVEFQVQLLQKYKHQLKLKAEEFLTMAETLMRRCRKLVDAHSPHPVNARLNTLLENWHTYRFEDAASSRHSSAFEQVDEADELSALDTLADDLVFMTDTTLSKLVRRLEVERRRLEGCLPAYGHRTAFLKALITTKILLVKGSVCGGHRFLVPQLVMEALPAMNAGRVICCTRDEPAAALLAHHAALDLGFKLGAQVGLLTGHQAGKLLSMDSLLIFTTALHLCALMCDPENVGAMRQTCVVVDGVESHAWEIDLLLSMLRLQQRRGGLRRIVMMANSPNFAAVQPFYRRAGRTVSEVEVVSPLGHVHIAWQGRETADLELCAAIVRAVAALHTRQAPQGDVLAFVPTPQDAHRCVELLHQHAHGQPDFPEYAALAFHELSPPETYQTVVHGGQGARLVIFATAIAEACGPLPRVTFVVDSGKALTERWDPALGTTVQSIGWVSRKRCARRSLLCASQITVGQRCFSSPERQCVRLFSQAQFEELPADNPVGLQSCDLTLAVLLLLAFGVDDVLEFECIVPMPHEAVQAALDNARRLGALRKGKLTDLGAQLVVRLALQPSVARFLMEGILRKCQSEAVTLVCLLAQCTPFSPHLPGDQSARRKAAGPKAQASSDNDLMVLLRTYQQWQAAAHRDRKATSRDPDLVSCTFAAVEKAIPLLWNQVTQLSPSLSPPVVLRTASGVQTDGLLHSLLCAMLLAAFPRNVAVFTGHRRSGYRLGVEGPPQYAHLHPDSVVSGNGTIWPRWVVYYQILNVDGDQFLRHVCVLNNVDEVFTALEAQPSHQGAVAFWRSLENEVVSKVSVPCGVEQILRKVVGDKRSGLAGLEASVSRELGCLCVIDVDRRLQALLIHVPFRFHRPAADLGRAAVAQARQALRDEDIEALLGTQGSGLRVVLAGGALARAVLLPNDYRALRVTARRLQAPVRAPASSVLQLPTPQDAPQGRFRRWMQRVFGPATGAPPSNGPRSVMTEDALESLDGDDACSISEEEWLRRSMPLYLAKYGRAQLGDVARAAHGAAEARVFFQSADDARTAFWELNHKSDEGFLLQLQPEHWRETHPDVPSPSDATAPLKLCTRLFLYWAPTEARRASSTYTPQAAKVKVALRTLLTGTNSDAPEDVHVLQMVGFSGHAYAEYLRHWTAHKVQRALHGKKFTLEGVERTLTLRLENSCALVVLRDVYAVTEEALQPILRHSHVESEVVAGAAVVQFVLRSNSVQQLYQVRQQLCAATQGAPYVTELQNRVVLRRLFGPWGTQLAQRVRDETHAFIHLDARLRTVTVYGTEPAKAAASRLLTDALARVSTKLVGHLQPAFIRYLLKSYGYHLEGLRIACNAVSVGVRGTSLLLEGEEPSLQSALQLISMEQAVLSQVPADITAGSGNERCAVCSDSLGSDCVYPSLCGHGHCLECMQALFHTAISERKLPLTCGFWDCDAFIAIRDVQSICDETQWAQVVEMATAALVQACPDTLQFCPTPGCPAVYRRPREREPGVFHCPECTRAVCTGCHADAHPSVACNQLPPPLAPP
eukprot:EG_transcript_191